MYFEFTDAEVAQCAWADGRLQMRFSAARLQAKANTQGHTAVWAPVMLTAEGVEPWDPPQADAWIGRLNHGRVLHDSQRLHQLPLPCQLQGVVTMELEFAQYGVLHVRCASLLVVTAQGAAVEAYQC